MDSKQAASEAHPESMDFLSKTWCNFAVQALHPPHQIISHQSIVPLHNSTSIKVFDCKSNAPITMEKSMKMDDSADFNSLPPWKTNDVKSWIWMQQAMHPDLNYNRRTWLTWKLGGGKAKSITKWIKERKQKRKEEDRLQKAQVHAAVSVAGIAAALAAIAADNSRKAEPNAKEEAVASAAALVATHCAEVARSMGAHTDHLSSVLGSAFSASSASDILTLTAAASTSIRGAETLKARRGYKKMLNGNEAVLPIEDSNIIDIDFDLERCKSILAHGTQLHVQTPNGILGVRSVSIYLNTQAQVILRMRKLNLLKTKKESIIMELQAELYKDSSEEELERDGTCYLIVLTTNKGITKLDMGDDYNAYNTWATTINHLLTLSSSSFS